MFLSEPLICRLRGCSNTSARLLESRDDGVFSGSHLPTESIPTGGADELYAAIYNAAIEGQRLPPGLRLF
jgi:hypothetical protein